MKDRFYKKNVVEAIPKMNKALVDMKKEYRKDIIVTIFEVLLCFTVAVLSAAYISKPTLFFFVPVTAKLTVDRLKLLYVEHKMVKEVCVALDKYSDVISKLQLKKECSGKQEDFENAKIVYKTYITKFSENHKEIIEQLQKELKSKRGRQFTISVLSGLLFLCENQEDRDVLSRARYRHGSAGNMVFSAWISYYDGDLPAEITKEVLQADFIYFWNKAIAK